MSDLEHDLMRLNEGKKALEKVLSELPPGLASSVEDIMEDFDDSMSDCMECLNKAIRECERLIKEGGNNER